MTVHGQANWNNLMPIPLQKEERRERERHLCEGQRTTFGSQFLLALNMWNEMSI